MSLLPHITRRITVGNLQCSTNWSELLTSCLGNQFRVLNAYIYPNLTFTTNFWCLVC